MNIGCFLKIICLFNEKAFIDDKYAATEMLSLLLEHKLYEYFKKDWKTVWKKAVDKDDLLKQIQLIDLLVKYYLNDSPQNLNNAEKILEWSEKKIELLQKKFLREVRSEEIHSSLARRIIAAYRKEKQLF
jgi:hypothetical protein